MGTTRMAQPLVTRPVVIPTGSSPDNYAVFNEEAPVTPAPMALLSSGVPLSLLLDLFLGPDSEDLLSHERLPEQRDPRD
jgi:hypothetical protein